MRKVKTEKELRRQLRILYAIIAVLVVYICGRFYSRTFFIDGPLAVKAEIHGEEHFFACSNIEIASIDLAYSSEEDNARLTSTEEKFFTRRDEDDTIQYFSYRNIKDDKTKLFVQVVKEFTDRGSQDDHPGSIAEPTVGSISGAIQERYDRFLVKERNTPAVVVSFD